MDVTRSLSKFSQKYVLPRRALLHFYGPEYARHYNIALHDKKIIFHYIPKNACTSIKQMCSTYLLEGGELADHEIVALNKKVRSRRHSYPYIPKYLLFRFGDYHRFAFIRNPWDRFLSFYSDKINRDVIPLYLTGFGFYPHMPFAECVKLVSGISDRDADAHFRSQHTFITDKNGKINVDFIGRLESFDTDMQELVRQSSFPAIHIPHLNKKSKAGYRGIYHEETRQLISQRYAKDIAIFNYVF